MLRPLKILKDFGRKYPGCWKLMENFAASRGKDGLPDYPGWCYVPVAGSYAVISGGGDGRVSDRG